MRRAAFGRGASEGLPSPGRASQAPLTTLTGLAASDYHCAGTLTDLRDALRKRLEKDGHWGAAAAELDGVMVGAVMPLTSQVLYPPHTHTPSGAFVAACRCLHPSLPVMLPTSQCVAEALPSGQLKPFPDNRTPPPPR